MSFDIFNLDPASFISDYPWLLLIIPILLFVGISFGWKKLISLYQMQGKPLRPLGVILKEISSLMFKEDIYCVVTRKGENIDSLLWLTWIVFWRWLTILTSVVAALSILNIFDLLPISLHGTVLFWTWIFVAVFWLYGVGHLRKVFAHRFSVLEKMFNVAASEMKYDGGANAKIYIYQYVLISGWKQVYYPEETQIMYSVNKFKATEAGRQAAFQAAFDSSVTDKNSWSYEWDTPNNRVICSPIPFLPSNIVYPFPDKHAWNEFPLGRTFGEEEVVWDVATFPHMLVAGTTGSGKSVTQRTILLHALQSPDWRVLLIDPKRVELSQYPGHPNVLKLATENDEAYALIQQLEQEMMNRYARMKEAGVNHFKSLPTVPPAILLMVDEVFALLELTAGASRTDPVIKEQNEMKAAMTLLVGKIARLGRAAGIHMVLATQRPDAKVLPGEVKANLDARIAQGRMDKTPSDMTLNSQAATKLPPIKGRAIYRAGNDLIEFQAYFLAPENLPEFLELSAMIVRGEGDFLFEDDEPELIEQPIKEKQSFKMPKVNMNLGGKFNAWVEKKKREMEENEARAGRSVVANKQPSLSDKEKYSDDAPMGPKSNYVSPEERARIEQEALRELNGRSAPSNGFTGEQFTNIVPPSELKKAEMLFPDESTPTEAFDFTYEEAEEFYSEENYDVLADLNKPENQAAYNFDNDDDFFDFDDEDLEVVNFEAEERAEKATRLQESENSPYDNVSPAVSATNAQNNPLDDFEDDGYDSIDDFENYEGTLVEEESFAEDTVLTVADVLRIAAERGVPIPASELLAALKAEAAAQNKPKPTQQPVRKPEYQAVKPAMRSNPQAQVVPKAPSGRIPNPPKVNINKETEEILASADFGEHLLDPEEISNENLPPWMVEPNVEVIEPAVFSTPARKIPGIERNPEDFLRPPAEDKTPEEPENKPKRPKLF